MLKALFYIPAIMFIVAIISDVFLRVYLVRGRKLILDSNAFNSLSKMLNLKGYELDNHIIQQSKSHFCHPLKNCVGIKSFDSRAVSESSLLYMKVAIIYPSIQV
ncbi:hypothetical protein JOE23_000670 [Amphibacillus cookii]|nr:hypothetical protein [Amphibacillus cookii]